MALFSLRNRLLLTLTLAGFGLALFFSEGMLGLTGWLPFPLDLIGASLFIAAVWFSVDAVHRVPASEAEAMIAPQEWQSWIGLVFCTAALVTLYRQAPAFAAQQPIWHNPEAARAGRSIGTLFVAWAILAYVLHRRWAGKVERDERDRRIDHEACEWGRIAITVVLVHIALWLAFAPTEQLQARSYPWLAQLLMGALLIGAWVDYAVQALRYWQDRRALDTAQ